MSKHNKKLQAEKPVSTKQKANDAYQNIPAGLGWGATNFEKSTEYPITRLTMDFMKLYSLYRSDGLMRRIVDKPVEDACAHWFKIDSQISPDEIDAIEKCMKQTQVKDKFELGMKWGRLFGGAAGLIMIDGQGDILDQPLDLKTIEPDSFKGIYIVDRWSGIYPEAQTVDDINSPDFGLPEYYVVRTTEDGASEVRVHYSRILRFTGEKVPYWEEQFEQHWGASVIETTYDALNMYNNSTHNIANLIFQANVWVRKMKNLADFMAIGSREQQERLYNALEAQKHFLSSFNTQILDADDDFQNKPYSFGGLKDAMEIFMANLSAVTHLPQTILFGRSPAGENATGESDLENYYTFVNDSLQETKMRPNLSKLLPIICMSELGAVPDDLNARFNPIHNSTAKENADLATQLTNAANAGYNLGITSQKTTLKEYKSISETTSGMMWSNITDEDIENADSEPQEGDMPPIGEPDAELSDYGNENSSNKMGNEEYIKRYGHGRATDSEQNFLPNPIPLAENHASVDSEIRSELLKRGIDIDTATTNSPIDVPIDTIKTTQNYLTPEKAERTKGWSKETAVNGNYPKVVHYHGQNYLLDGNHRTAHAMLRGEKNMPAWYYDLDKKGSKPTIDEIKQAAQKYKPKFKAVAVRTQEMPFKLGSIKHKSVRWSDGKPTDDKLDGLSCTSVGSSAIRKHTDEFDPREGQYQGNYCAIIGGNKFKPGHDKGEVVIRDPQVLEILGRN